MRHSSRSFSFVSGRQWITNVLLCLAMGATAASQVSPTGIDPFGTYQRNHIQTMNLFNLDNHIEIPIFTKTARDLTFTGRFIWDLSDGSEGIPCTIQGNPATCWITTPLLAVQTGTATYNEHTVAGSQTCQQAYQNQATIFQFDSITDEVNTVHSIQPGQGQIEVGPGCSAGTSTFTTDDNWLLKVTFTNQNCLSFGCVTSVTETDPQGNVHNSGNAIITNPNGNSLVSTSSGTTDSTGNVVWSSPSSGVYSYPVQGGGSANVQVSSSGNVALQNNPCFVPNEQNGLPTSTSITLPDGSQYVFVYESSTGTYPASAVTGRIHSITVPAGGTYTYTYSGGTTATSNTCTPLNVTITGPDGSNWTYNRVLCTSSCGGVSGNTVVTDPACNDTVYTFDASGRQMQALTYQGTAGTAYCSSSTKTLLQTVVSCYNGTFTNCGTTASNASCPSTYQLVCRQDTYTYLPGITQPSLSEIFYSSANLPTQDNEYDFGVNTGAAPTATPLQATMTTYASIGSNILNRPSCVEVTAGSSPSTCGTVLSTTNSITNYLNYDSHGNVGTIEQWVSGSSYLSTSFTYSSGLVVTTTDVNGAQTTNTNNACNGSYTSSIAEPLSLSRSMTWDCNGGVLTSVIDENSQTTSYANNDPFWRLTKVTDPLGNYTTYTYSPTTEESILYFVSPSDSNATVDKLTTYDTMGRPYLSQRRHAPGSSSFDTVVTGYDLNSRVDSVGLPCVSGQGQSCSSPVTTTTYDPLNRPLEVQDGGGGYTQYSYAPVGSYNNDVLVTIGPKPTGENLKERQMQYDGLGRLTSVCEVTSASGSGTCTQNSSQTGYWTEYSYNALGNLTGVTQNAQSSTKQTRTFTYDGLSRMTSESNPESGTTSYIYDSESSCGPNGSSTSDGDLLQKVDAAGRQVCYYYDALHRVTNIGNNNQGVTNPCKRFLYDNSPGVLGSQPTGVHAYNSLGRLAEAETDTCAWPITASSMLTDEWFSYSPRGEVADGYESTPNSGGYYSTALTYWANGVVNTLAGSLASGSTFVPTQTYTPDGEGRWNSVAGSSGPNPITSTSYNPASQITGITYGSSDSDSFLYDNAGRMKNYTFTVDGSSEVSAPTWNLNGTLGTLAITADPFNSGNVQTCNYAYDDLARITSANCGTPWSQTFSYDPFGNITKSGSVTWQPGYNSINQYTLAGTSYDADGNLTNDSFHTYSWNVYGRPATVGSKTLTYDALDRMAEKLDGGAYTQFVYNPAGGLLARMSGQSATSVRVPLPGSWAVYGSSNSFNHYEHLDWLGSSRLSSTQSRTVTTDVGYGPFGEPYGSSATSGISFTGMRSDVVAVSGGVTNGLYDFLEREYPPTQGRWPSPDPAGMSATNPLNPQSWNRYAYVLNNPLSSIDPEGLDCVAAASVFLNDDGSDDELTIADGCDDGGGGYPPDPTPPNEDFSGEYIEVSAQMPDDVPADDNSSMFRWLLQLALPQCGVSALSINNYLGTKNSPMVGQGNNFMNTGQKYNLDPRLLTSISGAETSFGKNITAGQYNAFNVLYNGLNSPFSSWQSAINSVGKSLTNPRNGYDLTNTATMYSTYCTTGSTCGAGLRNINTFMAQQGGNISALHFPCP